MFIKDFQYIGLCSSCVVCWDQSHTFIDLDSLDPHNSPIKQVLLLSFSIGDN